MRTEPDASTVAPPDGGATVRVRVWGRTGARVLAAAWCWTLLWLLVWTLVPRAFGWEPIVIESGSMSPLIRIGDVVVAEPDVDVADLAPGQIVTFTDPADGKLTTHRINALGPDGITTKGDANQVADTSTLDGRSIEGRARIVVPVIGLPRVLVGDGRVLEALGWLGLTAAAFLLSLSVPKPARRGRRSIAGRGRSVLRPAVAIVVTGALVGVAAGTASRAAFAAGAGNAVNTFAAAADFGWSAYLDAVTADGPEAHWRLGETTALPDPIFVDDFETFTGWNQYGAGTVAATSTWAHGGSGALLKNLNNDPNGGWKSVGTTLPDTWTLETWLYRPSGWSGGSIDRVGIEDSGFNGYSFGADHAGNTLFIDRRTGGSGTSLVSTAFDPPADSWYRLVLSRSSGVTTVRAYDGVGTLLASVATSDPTYSSFDRIVVHGGWQYAIDDIAIWDDAAIISTAVDQTGVHHAPYVGGPVLGQPGLIAGTPDTAVRFDGVDDTVTVSNHSNINLSTVAQRTIELWYAADDPSARQVLYEEGGATHGISVYLDGGVLHARAWSSTWSNDLAVSVAAPAGPTRHVVVVLDATGNTLTLYVDGAVVAGATKTDGRVLPAHSGAIGIGSKQGATRYHDGNSGGNGHYLAGVIDEVALYNSALTPTRIAAHFAAGS